MNQWDKLLPPEMPVVKRVKRSEWLETDEKPKYAKMKPARIVIHHSYSPTADQFKGDKTVRAIHRYHTKNNGWSDIGYHFIISPDGLTIYEGRPADAKGAHTKSAPKGLKTNFSNSGSIGICLIGNYDQETPTRAALYTLSILIFSLCDQYGINHDAVYGHCEAWSRAPKTCPGKKLFIELFGAKRWEKLKF